MGDRSLFAAVYDTLTAPAERAGLGDRRRRLVARASGRVLEIGAGTGANLAHYRDVDRVVAIEPSAAMRRRLLDKVAGASVPVEVHEVGIDDVCADTTTFPDASFDTVVSTLTLCTVPDVASAAAALRRVLADDGRVLFLEHVAVPGWRGRLQRAAAPAWKRLAAGCHLDRDIPALLRASGLAVTEINRFALPYGGPLVGHAVQGVAIKTRRAAREDA